MTPLRAMPWSTDRVLLWAILGGAALSKTEVSLARPGISVGDVLLAGAAFMILARTLVGASLKLSWQAHWFVLFWLSVVAGATFHLITFSQYFSDVEFFRSFSKLTLYLSIAVILIYHFRRVSTDLLQRAVLDALLISALIAIYIMIVMSLNLDLPYRFFWYGQPEERISNTFFRGYGFAVARGFFSEPSTLGIFQNLGLAYLYFARRGRPAIPLWNHVVVLISIILTFSLTAYFLLALNLLLYLATFKLTWKRSGILPYAIVGVMTAMFLSTFFQEAILNRLSRVFQGSDTSASVRVLGSWEVPLQAVRDSPVFGTGLGNLDIASLKFGGDLRFAEWLIGQGGWNILAYIFGTTGLLGFGIFLLLFGDFAVHAGLVLAVAFLASMFASGNFLESSFWPFYALFYTGHRGIRIFRAVAERDS